MSINCIRLAKPFCCQGLLLVGWLASQWFSGALAQPATPQQISLSQAAVLQAQEQHWRKVEVTLEAPVVKLLPDDRQGIAHQRFLIELANGSTVLIAHDTDRAPRVPLKAGDWVRIHGEYIWTEKGGVIHWTHHSDTSRHEGGWIDCRGLRYQ